LGPVGMIKIDLLGLGMLTMLQEGKKLVKQHRNIDLDLAALNMNDPAVFEMLSKADTIGIFQVESRAQMSILPRLKPSCFYDIVVSIALIRPGPIQGNVVHPYIRRRRGEEPVTYLHPSLEPVLERTLGVPLFQEQGMRLAVVAAGFTPAQADQLRKIMSFKRSQEKLPVIYEALAKGMHNNGFSQETIHSVVQQLEGFASYGFPESHSASFALLAYASAYLKKYFAPEFYCAMLNAQPMGFYSPATLLNDAMHHNVEIRPVDLSKSKWDCTLEDSVPALRIGLSYVQGLGTQAKESLEKAWEQGPFTSIEDVYIRSGLNQKSLQKLAHAGAFESFCPGRREALWKLLELSYKKELPLFQSMESISIDSTSQIPAMSDIELTVADYDTMHLTTGKHPMSYYRAWAESRNISSCAELAHRENDEILSIAGSVICRQRPSTAKGFVFLTLEDETGTANAIVRPHIFDAYRQVIMQGFLLLKGKLQSQDNVINLIASSIEPLPTLPGNPQIPSHNFH
jgi:error-prone DNA polymerase